ncbi:MAG: hypothetical protein DMG81_02705 [Acidobacteria bacterium]|nr:MAG: hypothetical protein DMG81_02705 [Acidobacteriota bacterium]
MVARIRCGCGNVTRVRNHCAGRGLQREYERVSIEITDTTSFAQGERVASGIVRPGWLRRIDAGLLMILGLPWLILRFDSTWLFGYAATPSGFIDPWVYFGFFLDLTQHIRTFKGAYFTTRLTWTVPGAIVYHLFSPIIGTYVLHLAVFYAASISLYLILKITVSQRAAVLATLLMAFHSYFLWSVGWSYVDGAGDAYLLMTICALTFASRSVNAKRWLLAAGAFAALTVYCQLFLIVFCPVVLGYYHFASRQSGSVRTARPWKPFVWGFAAITIIFGAFNMAVNGRFLFFINSLGTAAKLVVNHNPYRDSTYGWLSQASWLVLPSIAFIGACLCLAWNKGRKSAPNLEFLLFWQRFYVLSFATMVFWQLIGQPVLQLSTYTSYLLPGAFLALGAQLAIVTDWMKRAQFLLLCACVAFLSLTEFALPPGWVVSTMLQQHSRLFPFVFGVLGLLLLNKQVRYTRVLSVLLLCGGVVTLNATTGPRAWSKVGSLEDPAYQKSALLAVADSVRMVQDLDARGNLYFWYDGESRLGRLYRSVASTYLWSYRLQSESFPALGAKLPPVNRRILILSENGKAALPLAQGALAKEGLEATVLSRCAIERGPFRWDVIEIQVTANTGAQQSSLGNLLN